jgi:hypothetical protein
MSQVSSLSQDPAASTNPLADATAAQLKKVAVKFAQRLVTRPDEPKADDAAEVRKWVELARGDVVRGSHRIGLSLIVGARGRFGGTRKNWRMRMRQYRSLLSWRTGWMISILWSGGLRICMKLAP